VNRLTREQIGQAFSQVDPSIASSAATNKTSSITSFATFSGSDDNPEIQGTDKPPSVPSPPISLEYYQLPNRPATDDNDVKSVRKCSSSVDGIPIQNSTKPFYTIHGIQIRCFMEKIQQG
jgi:hypothetical protein